MAKSTKLSKKPSHKTHGKAAVASTRAVATEVIARDDTDESEEEDVDEEGLAKLMAALGDDALDEFDRAQLQALNGEDMEEGGDEDDEEADGKEDGEGTDDDDSLADSASEDGEHAEDGDEDQVDDLNDIGIARVALDDVSSVDEDAVPVQKVTTNNEVRPLHCAPLTMSLTRFPRSLWIGYTQPFN